MMVYWNRNVITSTSFLIKFFLDYCIFQYFLYIVGLICIVYSHIYIYMCVCVCVCVCVFTHLQVTFLNEPGSFVCSQLNCFKYYYLRLIILFDINNTCCVLWHINIYNMVIFNDISTLVGYLLSIHVSTYVHTYIHFKYSYLTQIILFNNDDNNP